LPGGFSNCQDAARPIQAADLLACHLQEIELHVGELSESEYMGKPALHSNEANIVVSN